MFCKKCGAELAKDAKFCGMCGSRTDSKKRCKACGQLVDENCSFCVYCGAKLVETNEENVNGECLKCDIPAQTNAEVATKTMDRKKLFNLIGGGLLALGAIFAFIFMFFIGVTGKTAGSVSDFGKLSTQLSVNGKGTNIFYFFGDFFQEFKLLKNSKLGYFEPEIISSSLIYGITGLLTAVFTFISVGIFTCLSIGVYIMNALGKTQKRADKWSILAICSFIAGSLIFNSLHTLNINIGAISDTSSGIIQLKMILNSSTKIAITLCLICLGLYILCDILATEKSKWRFSNVLPSIVASVGLICTIVCMFIVQNYGMTTKWMNAGRTYAEMTLGFGFLQANIISLPSGGLIDGMGLQVSDFTLQMSIISICNIVAQIVTITLIMCFAFSLKGKLKGVNVEKNQKVGLALPITICVFCFMLLATFITSSIIASELLATLLEGEGYVLSIRVGRLVVLLVLSIVNLVLSVCQRTLVKNKK